MIGYIAKDKDEEIYLYKEKPTYNNDVESWFADLDIVCITDQFPEFNNMSYKDEPIKVEIKLERI